MGGAKFSRWAMTDDIHARAPVDRLAAKVTRPGFRFDPQKRIQTDDSPNPLPTRLITPAMLASPNFQDLTGVRFGRFRVIGMAKHKKKHWVVRCACGIYSTRCSKAIKNPANHVDRCEHCRHWRRTGRELGPDSSMGQGMGRPGPEAKSP
jgi:hypothetical protein